MAYRHVIRGEDRSSGLAELAVLDGDEESILSIAPFLFTGTGMTQATIDDLRANTVELADPDMDNPLVIPNESIPAVCAALTAYYRRLLLGTVGGGLVSHQGKNRHSYCGPATVPGKADQWFVYLYIRAGVGWEGVMQATGSDDTCRSLAEAWVRDDRAALDLA